MATNQQHQNCPIFYKNIHRHFSHFAILLLPLFLLLFANFCSPIKLFGGQKSEAAKEDRVPDPPKNFRADQLTPNSMRLRWDSPDSGQILVRGYTLSYGTDTADGRKIVLEGADTREYTLNALKPNTSYALSLTAYNEAIGEDSARLLLLIKTPPLPARDAPPDSQLLEGDDARLMGALKPIGLRLERTRQIGELLLHWDEPAGDRDDHQTMEPKPLYYVVQYWRDAVKDREQHRLSVERSPALLTGLREGEKYSAKVRAVFADGSQSPWSDRIGLNGWPKWRNGANDGDEEEEDFCGFEMHSVCDFIREGIWRWQRRNSSKDGFNMVLAVKTADGGQSEQLTSMGEDSAEKQQKFGRLLSPVYGLKPSETVCLSVQLKLAKGGFGALFRLGVRFEGDARPIWLYRKSLQRFWPQGEWQRLSFQLRRRPSSRGFQIIFEVSKAKETNAIEFALSLDNLFVRAAECPLELEPFFGAAPDEETEANLLIPLENLIDTDSRVFRTTGLDGLPAVGIKRGVEIVVPYRIYLPRKFYRNFAVLASIRPADHQGGFLFSVLNAFDTIVELGVQLQPAGPAQTNISLFYTDSEVERNSRVLASFLVPAFTGQWTQFALEVHDQTIGLYFRCMRFAIRQVHRRPSQLQMDDASKLYIANAGPILGGGFEWKTRRRDFSSRQREGGGGGKGMKNNRHRPKDAEKSGLISSGFGPPEEEQQPKPVHPPARPPPSVETTTMATAAPKTTTTMTTMIDDGMENGRNWPEGGNQRQMMMAGPKGEKGEMGMPGTCSAIECRMPPPGPPGPPGIFPGLTESDIQRIAAWPGVKGDKGDTGDCQREQQKGDDDEVVLLNGQQQKLRELPPYEHRGNGGGNKGQKGEKGDRGLTGQIGPMGPPGPIQQQKQFEPPQQSYAQPTVAVYQTSLELLAAAPRCPIGSLAFAISTQQLFIRVHAGWRQIMLDKALLAQPAPSSPQTQSTNMAPPPLQLDTSNDSQLSRLAYWLALDEPSRDTNGIGNEGGGWDNNDENDRTIIQPPSMDNRMPEAQPWRARWPPKEIRPLMEEFEAEESKNREKIHPNSRAQQIRHKDRVLHLVALNHPMNGNFGGVRGADLECYRQARQSGFHTTFRAFLSSRVQDLNKLVHADDRHHTPIVNIHGERLFDSWDNIFEDGAHAHVPLYSFNRRDIHSDPSWSDRWLWHGSSADGLRSNAYCSEWRSSDNNLFGMGSPLHSLHSLTDQSRELNCNRHLAILCIEVMSKFNVNLKLGKRFMADLKF